MPRTSPQAQSPQNSVTCDRCQGTGRYGERGRCFNCAGTGRIVPGQRPRWVPRRRVSDEQAIERWTEFAAENPEVAAWMERQQATFPFAYSLRQAVQRFGSLTERQMEAAQRCVAREAAISTGAAAGPNVPAVTSREAEIMLDGSLIKACLLLAVENGLHRPSLTIGSLQLTLCEANGRYPGSIYVREDTAYLGRLTPEGDYLPNPTFYRLDQAARDSIVERLCRIAEDPAGAAQQHGAQCGRCSCCGRLLTDPESVSRGIGPVCARHFGFTVQALNAQLGDEPL